MRYLLHQNQYLMNSSIGLVFPTSTGGSNSSLNSLRLPQWVKQKSSTINVAGPDILRLLSDKLLLFEGRDDSYQHLNHTTLSTNSHCSPLISHHQLHISHNHPLQTFSMNRLPSPIGGSAHSNEDGRIMESIERDRHVDELSEITDLSSTTDQSSALAKGTRGRASSLSPQPSSRAASPSSRNRLESERYLTSISRGPPRIEDPYIDKFGLEHPPPPSNLHDGDNIDRRTGVRIIAPVRAEPTDADPSRAS